MKKINVAFLFFQLFCFFYMTASGEYSADVHFLGDIIGFEKNEITVNAPENGEVILHLLQGKREMRILRFPVNEGENTYIWDGLGEWEEVLDLGPASLEGVLTGYSGTEHSVSCEGNVGKANQHVLYALPSSSVLLAGEDWFCETAMVRSGKIQMDIYRSDGTLIGTQKKKLTGTPAVGSINWNGKKGKNLLPEGTYHLKIFPEGNESEAIEKDVCILHAPKASDSNEQNNAGSDAELQGEGNLWNMLMSPSVVADVDASKQLTVRKEARTGSQTVGRINGQTQAVDVIQTEGKWALVRFCRQEDGLPVEGYVPLNRLKTVYPNPEYAMVVDKGRECLTIYQEGQELASFQVSTGSPGKDTTPPGWYMTGLHKGNTKTDGFWYDCAIQLCGKNNIMRIGYKKDGSFRDYSDQRDKIGKQYGKGDILLPDQAEGEINAYWLWTHIPSNSRVLILSGTADSQSFSQAEDDAESGQQFSDEIQAEPPAYDHEIRVTLAGSVSLAGNKENAAIEVLRPFFEDDDASIVLLDAVVSDVELTMKIPGREGPASGSPGLDELKRASVQAVGLTTAHYTDYQGEGRFQTKQNLRLKELGIIGDGNLYVAGMAFRIGFTGIRQDEYILNQEMLSERMRELTEKNCDVSACLMYCDDLEIRDRMINDAVNSGAGLVVCCGSNDIGIRNVNGTPVILDAGSLAGEENNDTVFFILSFLFREHQYLGVSIEPKVLQWEADQPAVCTEEAMFEQFGTGDGLPIQKSMWFGQ